MSNATLHSRDSVAPSQKDIQLAWVVTLVVIVLFAGYFGGNLRSPGFYQHDEYLTLDRTLSVLETGDWSAIYSMGVVCMKKPPLQYFVGALLLRCGLPPEMALRGISLAFALGTLILVAAIAGYLEPKRPWAIPTASILMSSSDIFASHSRLALLDTGLSFFTTLSILAVLRAGREPVWWVVWGAACGLGSLQKAPVALPLSLLVMTGLLTGKTDQAYRPKRLFQQAKFRFGVYIAALVGLAWPLVQAYRFGATYRRLYLSSLIFRVTTGTDQNQGKGFRFSLDWLGWMENDAALLWVFIIITIFWALSRSWFRQRPELWTLTLPAVLVALGLTVSGGPVYPRYFLAFSPLLVPITATVWCRSVKIQLLPVLLACVVFFSNGERLSRLPYQGHAESKVELRAVGIKLNRELEPDESLLIFDLDEHRAVVGALVRVGKSVNIRKGYQLPPSAGKHMGIVKSENLHKLQIQRPDLEVSQAFGSFVIFRYEKDLER